MVKTEALGFLQPQKTSFYKFRTHDLKAK